VKFHPLAQSAQDIARALRGGKAGRGWIARCPAHDDRNPSLSIRDADGKVLVKCHAGCSQDAVIGALRARELWPGNGNAPWPHPAVAAVERSKRRECDIDDAASAARQHKKALWLWHVGLPPAGTPVEVYLRWRGLILDLIPASIRYLPPRPPEYPLPSMVCAYGIGTEPEPGRAAIPQSCIRAVHLTKLAPDGRGKAPLPKEEQRRTIASPTGFPIVLAPPNDGLGLAIGEGVETMLSHHLATGLGSWAAGAADFMPALAARVPDYVACVTVCAEADPAGQRGAMELAGKLDARGFEVLIAEAGHGPRL
jgi:putative DNA primase/helicase